MKTIPHPTVDDKPNNISSDPASGHPYLPGPEPFLAMEPPVAYYRRSVNWWVIILGLFITLGAIGLVAYSQGFSFSLLENNQAANNKPRFTIPDTPTGVPTPSATATITSTAEAGLITFVEPTVTPTPVPGGRILVLTPVARDVGWVVSDDESVVTSYDPQNHFGDSYVYSGVLGGKIYRGAIQFDLSRIPRGTKVYAASLRLTGLRADQLDPARTGTWQLQLLSPEVDYNWPDLNFEQIDRATVLSAFEPPLTQEQLGAGQANIFEFNPRQLALLERRILEGNDDIGRQVSFRLDGPTRGNNNLFAWHSGYGPASQKKYGIELFLSLGATPLEPPPPYYVVITSTPTPENVKTAAAISLRVTMEAKEFGTATPLPKNWVTPVVVTAMPTPENEETAQVMGELATAIALTTGQPPNIIIATPTPTYVVITSTPTPENVLTAVANSLHLTAEAREFGTATPLPKNWVTPVVVTPMPPPENEATAQVLGEIATAIALTTGQLPNLVTATPTPTYMIITSTPTPENLMTAVANALQITAEAREFGTATPLPKNWVTPVVVTAIPTPANDATVEYLQILLITTGTPTPTPSNLQTATPTPVFIVMESFVSPTPTPTPTPSPQSLPEVLLGKILFLSDREGPTEEALEQAAKKNATPEVIPQPYMFDPATGQLARLTNMWPYEVAVAREAWSADKAYWAYTTGPAGQKKNLAIFYYDYHKKIEYPLTRMGTGIAYDPAWSPVSYEVAFVATESRNDEIWTINQDGTNLRQLTQNLWEWDKHPSWSPDGQQIVFYSNRTGNDQLWIMNKDGSEQRLLMEGNPYNDWAPVWVKYLEPGMPPALTTTLGVPTATLTLLEPVTLDPPSYGLTNFEWLWTGDVPPGFGFEVRVWHEGGQPTGIHDAVLDNQNGNIKNLGEGHYSLSVDISNTGAVQRGNGDYLWTVALIQVSPSYADIGQQASPAQFRFAGNQ